MISRRILLASTAAWLIVPQKPLARPEAPILQKKQPYKCENPWCEYGDYWDRGWINPYLARGFECPIHMRADAYSQCPEYRKNGRLPWYGLCLNCLDDRTRNEEDAYYEY